MNSTIKAIEALIGRGWAGRSAFAYVCHLFQAGELNQIRALAADTRGTPAVEFALVAPVLAMMMIGTLDVGLVMTTHGQIAHAARAGAQVAAQTGSEDAGRSAALNAARLPGNAQVEIAWQDGRAVATVSATYKAAGPFGEWPIRAEAGWPVIDDEEEDEPAA